VYREKGWSSLKVFKLDQYLKFNGWVESGGEAKMKIRAGEVLVNGVVETRRGRQLNSGDVIELDGKRGVAGEE
jgi:ribosome-associated protein|tara:strand:+ start:271 stop:489 length:219 start_codon:yes stop_codon:yes gene_type:complete